MRIAHFIFSRIAKLFRTSKGLRNAVAVLAASVAELLLRACRCSIAQDVYRLKENLLKRCEAGTKSLQADALKHTAEAQKKVAEAKEATNKITQISDEQLFLTLKYQREALRNRKLSAEADVAEAKALKAKAAALKSLAIVIKDAQKKGIKGVETELRMAFSGCSSKGKKLNDGADNSKSPPKLKPVSFRKK